jgi:hypothetical protein
MGCFYTNFCADITLHIPGPVAVCIYPHRHISAMIHPQKMAAHAVGTGDCIEGAQGYWKNGEPWCDRIHTRIAEKCI